MFKGSLVALITPMRADGSVDEATLERFVDWQIGEGTHGLVPVGTTGESPTLTHEEHRRVVEITIAVAGGRVPVIAGAGSNSTAEAIDLAQPCPPRRGRCRARRHALLQQADAGRAVPAFHGHRRQRRDSDHHLQHARPQRGGYECRDHGPAGETPEYRRREGCDREPRPPAACPPRLRRRFLPALGRGSYGGRPSRLGRRRLHQRDGQYRAPPAAARCTAPGRRARWRRRWPSSTGWCRCTTRCSPRPVPARSKYAASLLGLAMPIAACPWRP